MNETQLPKHRKTQVLYEMGNRLARFELSLGAMSKNERVAGTSPSVAGDILGAYEELRWMEPHLSIPMHCCMKMCNQPCPVRRVHTHTRAPLGGKACHGNDDRMYFVKWRRCNLTKLLRNTPVDM